MSMITRAGMTGAAQALAGLLLALALAACGGEPRDVLRLAEAQFLMSAETAPPPAGAAWRRQPLPDAWQVSRPNVSGTAWYRFEVALGAPATRDYGFYLTAVMSSAQLWVNGRFAGQFGAMAGRPPDRWQGAQLFAVPRALLHEGTNVFDVRVSVGPRWYGGLGPVLVGDHGSLRGRELRDHVARFLAPSVASVAMIIVGAFILVLWLRRHEDHTYLAFGLGTILWGLHTALTLGPDLPLPSPHFEVWWNAIYVLFVALLCIFSVRFAGARWPRFEKGVLAFAALALPFLYAAAYWASPELRAGTLVRLGALALAAITLYAIVESALKTRSPGSFILLAAGGLAAVFGAHDWIIALDRRELQQVYLVPYAALFFVALIGWVLIDRFVKTLTQFEALNVDLERRVAEKSRALEVELGREEEARREAEKANHAKSRFLAAASHDLRQPLHALGLFAEALNAKTHDTASRELVTRINQSIVTLESLFNEVLDVSKLDAGAITPDLQAVALQPLFDRIGDDLRSEAAQKGIALRFVPSRRSVRSDPVLLERILRNLVGNAIRYTPSGAVLVGARPRAGRLAIEVRDSGIGIAQAEQARIFEEFYQVGNAARDRRKGLGLGLAIVKRLCELMGHALELASAPGRGSVFRVVLAPATEAPRAPSPAGAAALPSLQGTCIAIVDDEVEVRDSTAALLRTWGSVAVAGACADDILVAVAGTGRPPALLLVDYRLREGESGLECAQRLRAAFGQETPAIIVSGESSAAQLALIQASGLPLLHKPVAPARLRSLILHLLADQLA